MRGRRWGRCSPASARIISCSRTARNGRLGATGRAARRCRPWPVAYVARPSVPPEHVPMKLSVAMPTYNGAAYLRAQLESIAGQARLPDELVLVDDASADDTLAVARDFARSA